MATIEVFGFDIGSYLERLRQAGVSLLLDVRRRRGVRGAEYAWANARRLQDAEACHRSLIAQRLTEGYDVTFEHLRPL
ncbi:hypothetical protein AB0395_40860 [Streptosporangium sp. NPDC051023]|uniref:hypothetical protein n=1 Tax=Streptosporangium sp. NPDC051023 TaxID=3155410 RepID=UPI00344C1DA8